jgi:hypothetical protein
LIGTNETENRETERGNHMAVIFREHPGEIVQEYGSARPRKKRYYTRQMVPPGISVEECSFCGQPTATGYWRAVSGIISVCPTCAVDTLPKLQADAVVGEHLFDAPKMLKACLLIRKAVATFWAAVDGLLKQRRAKKQRAAK